MQLKTIQKIITTKLLEWIGSIQDEALRIAVKKNCLVSGGSIVSLLSNQDVNDFDVYIKDMDVLKRLVTYYASPHKLEVLDGRDKESLMADIPQTVFYEDDKTKNDSFMAVMVRNLRPDQIKIVAGYGGKRVNEGVEIKEYTPVFFSPNAISLSGKIQIVCRFHGNSDEIHKTFDFVHATNYFTFEEGLVTRKEALESLITKQLKYQGSMYPLTSIIRMKKFIKRGWNISAGEILKIMFQISELDLRDPDVLEEQLIGVDVAYFGVLIEILRGMDEDKTLTSHMLNTIIDKVFSSAEDVEE